MTAVAPRAGVLGLGLIGSRVAARVQSAGFPLAVWNRTARPFDGLPALAPDPAAVARALCGSARRSQPSER